MKLSVNLSTTPATTHRLFFLITGVLIGISGIFGIGLGWHVAGIRKLDAGSHTRRVRMERDITSLMEQREDLARYFAQPENARLYDRASLVNTIIDEESFNWTQMFMDLEHVLPGGVHVINIELRRANGQALVKLTVGAVSEQSKNEFLQGLEQANNFSHVVLANVRPADPAASEDKLILELTLAYSGA